MKFDDRRNMNLEYFKYLRQEILDRISKNTNLWSLKVTMIGVIFTYIGTTIGLDSGSDHITLAGAVLGFAPWMCLAFDFLILDNLKGIHSIGTFIKDHVEPHLDIKWEEKFGQKNRTQNMNRLQLISVSIFAVACTLYPFFISVATGKFCKLSCITIGNVFPILIGYLVFIWQFLTEIDNINKEEPKSC